MILSVTIEERETQMSKEAIRLILHQSSANYRKPETYENKMTYPLPPCSTVIGAVHKACGYTETHKMDVSIQGKYGSMGRRLYRDLNFMNSTFDDRGTLVKMTNESMLSTAFVKVAEAKRQGSSFEKNTDIKVIDQKLLEEYQTLKALGREIQRIKSERLRPELDRLKRERKRLADCRKQLDKLSAEYGEVRKQEEEIKEKIRKTEGEFAEYEKNAFSIPYSRFRVVTNSVKQYEILYDLELVIHITSDDRQTMEDIFRNAYNITALGRSEDFVDVKSADWVTLSTECEEELYSGYSAYIDIENARKEKVLTRDHGFLSPIIGTKYAMPKLYTIDENGRRTFERKKVLYVSRFHVTDLVEEDGIYVDMTEDGKYYIVNFL